MNCRKSVRDLTAAEKSDFVDAVLALKHKGRYDQYVAWHVEAMTWPTPAPGEPSNPSIRNAAHRGPSFLPWHRKFLRRFEADLQAEVPGVTVPYWDWTQDETLTDPTTAPVWSSDLMGGDGDSSDGNLVKTGPFKHDPSDPSAWKIVDANGNPAGGLQRTLGQNTTLPTDADAAFAQATTPYDESPWNRSSSPSYRNVNEGWLSIDGKSPPNLHNRGHVWVGGSMLPATSPNDPIFFLHHCFIDKLWADWQRDNPTENFVPDASHADAPPGHRLNDEMYPWTTTPADVLDHHSLGYRYDTDPPEVELETPGLTFNDVPEGETTVRAAVFSVEACENVRLDVVSGPTVTSGSGTFGTPQGTSVTVADGGSGSSEGRVWISYTGTTAGETATGNVTIRCVQTAEEWTVPITANTVSEPTVAVDMVLDRSGSMGGDSGVTTDGGNPRSRMDVLEYSAPILVTLLDEDDAVGVVSFNEDAQNATSSVAPAGAAPFGAGRTNATNAIQSLTPQGLTSIGDGVARAHARLGPLSGYDSKSTVVFTDGHENRPQYISDVSDLIDERVFAVGMGTAEQLRPAALDALTDGTGGYLLMTDRLDADDYFRLAKYFLQVLSGVKNTDIVVDPEGRLPRGQTRRIPFELTEADIRADVVLLAPARNVFELVLETPSGETIDPGTVGGHPEASHVRADNVTYYRTALPTSVGETGAHEGTWHAIFSLDEQGYRRYLNEIEETDPKGYPIVETHGVRYNLSVHARSNLRLRASLSQSSREPGATVTVRARLTESDLPVENRASVRASVVRPDATTTELELDETDPGVFETEFDAALSGVYRCTLHGEGWTRRGNRFEREQLLTASVWSGGDRPTPTGADDRDERLCRLLQCLSEEALAELFERWDVDPDALQSCIREYCRNVRPPEERPQGDDRRGDSDVERLLSDARVHDALSSLTDVARER